MNGQTTWLLGNSEPLIPVLKWVMAETIYAAFESAAQAEKAASNFLENGYSATDLSLVISNSGVPSAESTAPEPDTDEGLNPAQMDYPVGEGLTPTAFSSRPPSAKSDYNPNLDTRGYNADYKRDVELDLESDARNSVNESDTLDPETPPVNQAEDPPSGKAVVADKAQAEAAPEEQNKAKFAAIGAGLGVGVGALAAVFAAAIPGIGLVLGGGALAAGLAKWPPLPPMLRTTRLPTTCEIITSIPKTYPSFRRSMPRVERF